MPRGCIEIGTGPLDGTDLQGVRRHVITMFGGTIGANGLGTGPFCRLRGRSAVSGPGSNRGLCLAPSRLGLFVTSRRAGKIERARLTFNFTYLAKLHVDSVETLQ